jgi:hypothetical protein
VELDSASGAVGEAVRRSSYRPAPASRDPFFDKPYEPTAGVEAPSWEKAAPAASLSAKALSPYIKPKKKVAALFGAKRDAEPETIDQQTAGS